MNVLVSLEHRFDVTSDGAVWTQTTFPYNFWTRYLEVFSDVKVLARVRQVKLAEPDWQRVTGEHVRFCPVPYFLGPQQYLSRAHHIRRSILASFEQGDAVIMRVGSTIASTLEPSLRRIGYPFGLEVVGNPRETFAPGAVKHPLRPFFRLWFSRQLRHQCSHASAVAYVTERMLQRQYPADTGAFTTHYSSIQMEEKAFVSCVHRNIQRKTNFDVVFVGSLAQLYKAPDVLIKAIALVKQSGQEVKLRVVGDGKHRSELETLSASLGISEQVQFLGQLSAADAVRDQLDASDVFVLPSYQEGLPRAMIEAMARGLPCIGSTVGGIPELLPPEDMVPPGDAAALAQKICEVITNPERMAQMSARNLEKAKEYREEVLRTRRIAFYSYVKDQTDTWLRQRHGN